MHYVRGAVALMLSYSCASGQTPVPTVDQEIKKLAAAAPLAMRFEGTSGDECRRWQKDFAAKLRELLGPACAAHKVANGDSSSN